ncbi:Alginate biosynthesis sensor protein KinB [Gemmata sp. SH-PL17]|uniref:sensor histidine kinase n=1 Tax=Gemmata sp. SH-PL17 TaxID=1630693 RepID=UPI00078EA83E|nr:ATP-binding protein [Gemmata sp. SH-PL17]AMV28127.1 Alginate biosynthesis sensor protein KinB [Gemmata sp. SH-PL17]
MRLRTRILLAFLPLVALLTALGTIGFAQLDRTGTRIDAILEENYASVQAMFRLNEALERMDSSFQFALSGRTPEKEAGARNQFEAHWRAFEEQFRIEEGNVTIYPDEDELVARLRILKDDYRRRGVRFFASPRPLTERHADYEGAAGDPGLLGTFQEIKTVSGKILRINQESMERARDDARQTARRALVGFGISLGTLVAIVFGIAWYLLRKILGPIRAVTEATQAIGGSGQFDREVPVFGRDELGQLAKSFNAMTAQLRQYRRSNLDRIVRAQRTAQATIDSFSDPILVVEPGGRVELANPPAQGLLGVAPAGSDTGPMWQPPDPLRVPLADALQTQRAYQPEGFDQVVSFRAGGEERTYLPQIRPIRSPEGDTLGAAVVLNDVTRFRLLDQFKSDLVATVSHELKTPLTSVRLAVHVLLEETVGPLTPKQTELLLDARDGSERLLALIDQLLALARLQRPRDETTFTPADPTELLRHAAEEVRSRAADKHVELALTGNEPAPLIAVDATRIGQALGNILNNAITYTAPGGRITLTAGSAADGRVVLTITDTGVGIPAEYLPHVFDRFFRIPGQSDEAGTGLGLAIVKEVVTAHRGEVTCVSEPGKGTTFRITLPTWDERTGAHHDH